MFESVSLLFLLPIFVAGAVAVWLAGVQLSDTTDVIDLPATLLSGQAVLPQAKNTDIYLASLGALLTAVYIYGLIFRPKRQVLSLGIDSLVVLLMYIVGVIGLFTIVRGH